MNTSTTKVITTFATEEYTQAAIEKTRRKIFEVVCPKLVDKFFEIKEDGRLGMKDGNSIEINDFAVDSLKSASGSSTITVEGNLDATDKEITAKTIYVNGTETDDSGELTQDDAKLVIGGCDFTNKKFTLVDQVTGKQATVYFRNGQMNFDYDFEPIVVDKSITKHFNVYNEDGVKVEPDENGECLIDKSAIELSKTTKECFYLKWKNDIEHEYNSATDPAQNFENLKVDGNPFDKGIFLLQYTYQPSWVSEVFCNKCNCGIWVSNHWEQNLINGEKMIVEYIPSDYSSELPADLEPDTYQIEIKKIFFKRDRKCVLKLAYRTPTA